VEVTIKTKAQYGIHCDAAVGIGPVAGKSLSGRGERSDDVEVRPSSRLVVGGSQVAGAADDRRHNGLPERAEAAPRAQLV